MRTCVYFSTVQGVGRRGDWDEPQLVPGVHKALVLVLGEGVQVSCLYSGGRGRRVRC